MKKFRLLTADEIECRIAQIKSNGLSLLLYKDARCDMNILDETVGAMNWTNQYSRDNRNCIVSIYDADKGVWIAKENTGTESYTEAEKGLASDSFKRACVNWGIGRELYSAPFIWIDKVNCNITADGTKYKCYDRFEVETIEYDDKERISGLTIVKVKGRQRDVVFTYKNPTLPGNFIKTLSDVATAHGYTEEEICSHFGVKTYAELTVEQFKRLMDSMGANG